MAKNRKSRKKPLESPLTSAATNGTAKTKFHRPAKSQKRARKETQEDLEESELTNLLFGNALSTNTLTEEQYMESKQIQASEEEDDFTFQIDRTGVSMGDEEPRQEEKSDDEHDDASDSEEPNAKEEERVAWEDPDDDDIAVSLLDSGSRLKKLRTSRGETEEVSGAELENRLRKRYERSAQATARTDWARARKKTVYDDDDDETAAAALFSTSTSLFADRKNRLPPNVLSIVRCPDANQTDPNKAVVQAVHFHPGSDPAEPLLLTAGLDKTLRFFQVGPEKSEKIHGIHFPRLPIYSASFLGDTGNVVVSGRRPFFYIYDAVAGKVDLVPKILGREEKSWERHVVSPDGGLIAFMGNDGYVVLVDSQSKHWVGDLKMNGSVRAVTFTPDGKYILASGSDGDVYRWDVNSRRCVERFSNDDGTITAGIAASSQHVAVGAESGVVNLYSENSSKEKKAPLKSIMNLHTSAEFLRFNHDGQILAMSTQREQHGLKLLHVPTKTVFSNWPTSKTPLKYVWSMDFSPKSRYLAVGNDKGKCLLYRLNHYQEV